MRLEREVRGMDDGYHASEDLAQPKSGQGHSRVWGEKDYNVEEMDYAPLLHVSTDGLGIFSGS